MTRLWLAVLAVFLCTSPAWGWPQPDLASIDDHVQSCLAPGRIPGLALAIVHNDTIVHSRGFGTARAETPVTPDTPFIIGSVSKPITALAVMQLADRGLIRLDAPLPEYIPWFGASDTAVSRITIRQLLTQTSGISGAEDRLLLAPADHTLESRVRDMGSLPLSAAPGEQLQYSSWNYLALGLLIETVSAQSYGDYIQNHIFEPLGMTNSFSDQTEAQRHGLAAGHRWWFGVPVPAELPYRPDLLPAGYIISTAHDLARFLAVTINHGTLDGVTVLPPHLIADMLRPAADLPGHRRYGMGWGMELIDDNPVICHDGLLPNYFASVMFDPDSGWGVVVLSNAANLYSPNMTGRIAGDVLMMLKGNVPRHRGLTVAGWYVVADLLMLILTVAAAWSFRSLRRWGRKLAARPPGLSRLLAATATVAGDLMMPFFLLYFIPSGAGFPLWRSMIAWQPDISCWALALSILFVVKAGARTVIAVLCLRPNSIFLSPRRHL